MLNIDSPWEFGTDDSGELRLGLCDYLEEWGWGEGREEFQEEGDTCVYQWLIHVDDRQKPTQCG